MKDNSGFFILIVIIVIIASFFNVKPTDLSNDEDTVAKDNKEVVIKNNDTKTDTNTDTKDDVTAKDLENQIKQAERDAKQLAEDLKEAELKKTQSEYYGMIEISSLHTNNSGDAKREYLSLRSNYKIEEPINITGWTIKSLYTGTSIKIGNGTDLFLPNNGAVVNDIKISKSQSIYINSGKSPISYSFRINKCSGYHEQFLDFYPSISKYCPYPIDDAKQIQPSPQNEKCLEYIEDMPRCEMQTESIPYAFTSECTEYINLKVNYPSCVDFHKNDTDFYRNEWRIYLDRTLSLWRNQNEIIELLDRDGKIVDVFYD